MNVLMITVIVVVWFVLSLTLSLGSIHVFITLPERRRDRRAREIRYSRYRLRRDLHDAWQSTYDELVEETMR